MPLEKRGVVGKGHWKCADPPRSVQVPEKTFPILTVPLAPPGRGKSLPDQVRGLSGIYIVTGRCLIYQDTVLLQSHTDQSSRLGHEYILGNFDSD